MLLGRGAVFSARGAGRPEHLGGLVLPTLHDSRGRGACGKADLRLAALMGLMKVLCWGIGGQGSGLISSGWSGNPLPG